MTAGPTSPPTRRAHSAPSSLLAPWRRSLLLRVTLTTLALSALVMAILGFLLPSRVTTGLLDAAGGEEGGRKKTKYEREQAALRAREIEANRAREQAEYVAKKRKAETLEAEAERAFEALCAEKVKTYARSYDEAWTRDLQYDALGRNNVDALRGKAAALLIIAPTLLVSCK